MAQQIQLRRGTASEWSAANPTLSAGELGVESDTGNLKFGDGATAWNDIDKIYKYGDTAVDGQITIAGSSGNLFVSANPDAGEYHIAADASGTLYFYGTAGNQLDLLLLDGDLTLAHYPTIEMHAANKGYVDALPLGAAARFETAMFQTCAYDMTAIDIPIGVWCVAPQDLTIDTMGFFLAYTSTGSATYHLGIYDNTFNLVSSGTVTSSGVGSQLCSLGSAVVIPAGELFLPAIVATANVSSQHIAARTSAQAGQDLNYNIGSGGTLPSSIGGVSSVAFSPYLTCFEAS